MDEGRFPIAPDALPARLGAAGAPVVDARCAPAVRTGEALPVAAALVAATALWPPGSPAPSAANKIDIAAMPPKARPPGFSFRRTGGGAPAEWRVVVDPSAAGKRAIAQVSKDTTDYRFPLAVYQAISATNVDVVVRFKPVAGSVDRAGGIAVRLATPDNYYVVRANALEDNVNIYRVVNGRRQKIKGFDVKVASDRWHTLGLRAEGDQFTVSFDGNPLFTVEDKTLGDEGKVALWTKADSVTHFDQIAITPLD